ISPVKQGRHIGTPGTKSQKNTRNVHLAQYAVKNRQSVPPGPMRTLTAREHFGQRPS
ncbi:hypothetical protein LCGC14_2639540, partial [marine sediment metagenome]